MTLTLILIGALVVLAFLMYLVFHEEIDRSIRKLFSIHPDDLNSIRQKEVGLGIALIVLVIFLTYLSVNLILDDLASENINWITVLCSFLNGVLFVILLDSIKMPRALRIHAMLRFNKPYCLIANVEGKRLNKPDWQFDKKHRPWSLLPLDEEYEDADGVKHRYRRTLSERWNIYFFLPFIYKFYRFPFTYKKTKVGNEKEGDTVVWKNEDTKEMVVSRTGVSHYVLFRAEYPTITTNLDTKELATVHVYSNNILEAVNVWQMLFGIDDWMGATNEVLNGSLKGLVAKKSLEELNQYSSEEKKAFNEEMKESNEKGDPDLAHPSHPVHPGLLDFGVMLYKSVFKDFEPANANTKLLMESYTKVIIAEQDAKAYEKEQEMLVKWKKKWLVDTGLAEVDSSGNITQLKPDANVRVSAEALKELSKVTGTLVLGDDVTKILNIPTTPNPSKKTTTTGGVTV